MVIRVSRIKNSTGLQQMTNHLKFFSCLITLKLSFAAVNSTSFSSSPSSSCSSCSSCSSSYYYYHYYYYKYWLLKSIKLY